VSRARSYYRHAREQPRGKRPGSSRRRTFCENPSLDPQLKGLFEKIGVPESTAFRPDPFQLEALDKLETYDVVVSAPTGSGKTRIATEAIHHYLSQGLKTWYASPLKALSNAIYQEFCREFGAQFCGILTGDRKENPAAPVIVGTTEILRNQLYDAMHEGVNIQADLVILDEAHYLSDPERGVVWEEVLIYLPGRVKLLLLSATISNAEEICAWLAGNRGREAWVVRSRERPVPLETLFLFPGGMISPLDTKKGLVPKVKKFLASYRGRDSSRLNFGDIIQCLRTFDLLPAIFFLRSRLDCDRALYTCIKPDRPHEFRERMRREVREFLHVYPHLEGHRQIRFLLDCRVASHHAGQLPYWKLLVERLMVKGYLEAIFATSTVAAGVNFPARTVVLVQSDRFDGRDFSNLTATDLHQMTGRAGRRGKDNIGFALIVPGLHQDPQLIHELRDSPPEPLMSQIHINFSMTLNLLLSHRPAEIRDLLSRSFASFQEKQRGSMVERRWEKVMKEIKRLLPVGNCDTSDPYEVLENIQKRSELRREARHLADAVRKERLLAAYREYLKPGRLFLHKNRNVYVVFRSSVETGTLVCAAHNLRKMVRFRKGDIRLRRVEPHHIKTILDYRVELPKETTPEKLQSLFSSIPVENLNPLPVDFREKGSGEDPSGTWPYGRPKLACEGCEHIKICDTGKKSELRKLLSEFRSLAGQVEGMGGGLWLSFKRHLRFLKETRFVDERDRLTPDGIWASKLRLDHPLLIAEAIREGGFDEVAPETMAGCLAPFVWDRVQDLETRVRSPMGLGAMEEAFQTLLSSLERMRALLQRRGFVNPQIPFWPAAALFLWAKGMEWQQLLYSVPVDEGDMASLIVRTADHLRQVANLEETHPELASRAKQATRLILREPVHIE
jgi:ATP-dependent RNA helicase HelY